MGHVKDRWTVMRDGERVQTDRYGKGKRWQVWLTVDGKPRCGGSFPTKAVAERKLRDLESAADRGQWVDPSDQTTVAELVRSYLAGRPHRRRSRVKFEGLVRLHIEATTLGPRRAVSVRPSQVQAWVIERSTVLSPRTLQQVVQLLRSAFTAAVLDRVVAVSPCERLSVPRVEGERIVPLTVAQVRALADAIGPQHRAMVVTQAALGLRISELLALRTGDVDFLGRSVRIEEQIERETRARVPLKTGSSRRTLPLPDMAALELSRHIAEFPPAPDGVLFHTRSGMPLNYPHYCVRFVKAADAAGLPDGTNTHDLRHHYASVLLAGGQSVVAVAELLGHQNAALVLSTYGHLLPGSEDQARRAMESAWSQPVEDGSAATTQ